MECLTSCNRGDCNYQTGNCTCDFGFLPPDSSVSLIDILGNNWWLAHRIIFGLVFGVLAVYAAIVFFWFWYYQQFRSFKITLIQGIFIITFLDGLVRLIWLSIDPFDFFGLLPPAVETVLYGIGGTALIGAAYILIIVSWADAYHKATRTSNKLLQRLKPCGLTCIVGITITEIIVDIVRTIPAATNIALAVYYAILAPILLTLLFGYTCYGRKLYKSLANFETSKPHRTQLLKRITVLASGTTAMVFITLATFTVTTIIEQSFFHYQNAYSFYVFSWLYRTQEAFYLGLILFSLQRTPAQIAALAYNNTSGSSKEPVNLPDSNEDTAKLSVVDTITSTSSDHVSV